MTKGFVDNNNGIKTPNDIDTIKKPLNPEVITSSRVDINILKSKLKDSQNKEFRKNLIIFIFFLLTLGTLGIYLSI